MPRRRRRKSAVPFIEWVKAFSISQRMISEAYNRAADAYVAQGKELPYAFGAVFRVALNKVILPKLRAELAARPGVESPEEIAAILRNILDQVNVDELRAAMEALGVKGPELEAYLATAQEILGAMKQYLAQPATMTA